MNTQQRAQYLLAQGVEARLGIDPTTLTPGYGAHVVAIGQLPVGYSASSQAAIDAGTAWLRTKAGTSGATAASATSETGSA